IEPQMLAEGSVAVVRYDLTTQPSAVVTAEIPCPVDFDTKFKRLDIAVRPDETWHEMNVSIQIGRRQYESVTPKYMGEDKGLEYQSQLPSADDAALTPHRYVLLKQSEEPPYDETAPGCMRLHVALTRTSTPGAYWAKGSENYKRVFDEVPFWRYL